MAVKGSGGGRSWAGRVAILAVVAVIVGPALCAFAAEDKGMVTVVPEGTDEVIFNPGMGLAFCSWAAPPQWLQGETTWVDEVSDHVYIRVMWKDLNPAPGVYTIEESEIGRWARALKEAGRRFSLRIMPNCLTANAPEDVAPAWIYETGVEYVMIRDRRTPQKFPVPWGEAYLNAMDGIVAELARLYDGDPHLEYVDVPVGSFGEIWFFGDYEEWCLKGYSADRVVDATKDLIDLYRKHFKRTRLALPLGEGHMQRETRKEWIRNQVLNYCQRTGVMPRQDGVWDGPHWLAPDFRRMSPHVGTMYEPVKGILQNPGDSAEIYRWALEGAPSYFNWYGTRSDRIEDESERERLRDFARKIGYRFTLSSVAYRPSLTVGKNRRGLCRAELTWRNDGVAYCHEDVKLRLAVLDEAGGKVVEERRWPLRPVNTWAPGAEVVEPVELRLPGNAEGRMTLAVGLVTRRGTNLNLALKDRRSDGLYPVASFTVRRRDFEQQTLWRQGGSPEGWHVSPGMKLEASPSGGPQQGPCLRLSGRDASNSWGFAGVSRIPAVPGAKYRFSGTIKVDEVIEGRVPYVKLDFDDEEGQQLLHNTGGRSGNPPVPKGGFPWTEFALEGIAPAGTRWITIAVEKGRPAPAGAVVRLADLQVQVIEMP